jgi:3-phosphoglycerate kinase
MEKPTLESRWNEKIPKLKKLFPKLTDDDVKYVSEGEKALLENLRAKTGKSKEELRDVLDSL